MDISGSQFSQCNPVGQFAPLEELLEITRNPKRFTIGLPTESDPFENRILLVPSAVAQLSANGHQVVVQRKAALRSNFTDQDYANAGAILVESTEEVFQCDVILKLTAPTDSEIALFRPRQILISSIQFHRHCKDYFRKLSQKRISALALELIRDDSGMYPALRAMSEIAGPTSVLIAAEYLRHPEYGRGTMLGGVPGVNPSQVVILGAGTVGEFAANTALAMGASVKVFDDSVTKLRSLQINLKQTLFTSILQPAVLSKALSTADVVIGAIHSKQGRTPMVITERMVGSMKQGSIIVDVSIDQGGCCETSIPTTLANPVYQKFGVTHYCVPNIASKVPRTASYAMSNIFTPIALNIGNEGGLENTLRQNQGLRLSTYLFNGILTNRVISEKHQLPFQDLDLLLATLR